MKKKLILLLIIIATIFTGCSNNETDSTEIKYSDEDFLVSFQKGIEKRWDLSDVDLSLPPADQKKEYEKAIDLELNELEKYSNENFEDTKLKEKALSYINILKNQKDSLKYFTVDEIKFLDEWEKTSKERSKLITDIIDTYKLEFNDKYKDILDEFKLKAQMTIDDESKTEEIDNISDGVEFIKVKEEYGMSEYEVVLTNTSSSELAFYNFDISLIDENGIVVENAFSSASNWKPGQQYKFTFSTGATFAKMEYTVDYTVSE